MASIAGEQKYALSQKDNVNAGIAGIMNDYAQGFDSAAQNKVPMTFRDLRDPKDYRVGVLRLQDALLRKIRQQVTPETSVELIRDYRFLTKYRKTNTTPIESHENRHFLHDRFQKYDLKSDRAQQRRGFLLEDYITKMTLFSMFSETKGKNQTQNVASGLMKMAAQL